MQWGSNNMSSQFDVGLEWLYPLINFAYLAPSLIPAISGWKIELYSLMLKYPHNYS